MTELFDDVPESLSPYDQWLRDSQIMSGPVASLKGMNAFDQSWADSQEPGAWCAVQSSAATLIEGVARNWHNYIGVGMTEPAAILDLCNKLDIPLYGADAIKRKESE